MRLQRPKTVAVKLPSMKVIGMVIATLGAGFGSGIVGSKTAPPVVDSTLLERIATLEAGKKDADDKTAWMKSQSERIRALELRLVVVETLMKLSPWVNLHTSITGG